ncbi:hypothetical protein BBK36DRAFT_1176903 [Trichoderma citrinoviride]|uniref:Uncharacterized protein n=1 Tax=Trichoderma citrinoviride TaxID=58853 RepID=A0A2T4B5M2_9HYPO|nr:hypothetical protein BBK36DRAFT_1176903 [Trichoderma citrinoviride]PTB64636.1 hypothetical protein BBK36DRAFT_1176903 [Trichoderma citrinoviride]
MTDWVTGDLQAPHGREKAEWRALSKREATAASNRSHLSLLLQLRIEWPAPGPAIRLVPPASVKPGASQSASFSARKAPDTGPTGLLALSLSRAKEFALSEGICPLSCRKSGPALRQSITSSRPFCGSWYRYAAAENRHRVNNMPGPGPCFFASARAMLTISAA